MGMLDLATEKEHLAKADSDIAEGERRIARQADLIEEMRGNGQGMAEAEHFLDTLRQTLQAWRDHRDIILSTIARLEGAATTSDPEGL
jgi:hypothetical protein